MAALQVFTTIQGENEDKFNFDKWVSDNKLNSIKDLLTKHNLTNKATLTMTSTEFQNIMSDPQLFIRTQTINKLIPTIIAAIQKLVNDDNESKSKIIVISEQEEKLTNKLNTYYDNITTWIKQLDIKNNELTSNIEQCQSQLNTSFDNLCQQIENKKQEMMTKLQNTENERKEKISTNSQILNEVKVNVENAVKTCSDLVEDGKLDRSKRKAKIISIANDTMNKQLTESVIDIEANIGFQFTTIDVKDFVCNLCCIYGADRYPLPIISNASCSSITSTETTIVWNASLSEEDLDKKLVSTLFMKIEMDNNFDFDEKEIDSFNSGLIKFDPNISNYQCKLKISQPKNQTYGLIINVYETADDGADENKESCKLKKRLDHKPISIYFVDKCFEEGIIKAIGTNYGKSQFSNPATSGIVRLKTSGNCAGVLPNIIERTNDEMNNYLYDKNNKSDCLWFSVDFGGFKVKPISYSLKQGTYEQYLRDWNLEGSNDGNKWTIVKHHKDDRTINATNRRFGWKIDECNQTYKMFRVMMTGTDSAGKWELCCSFEICGYLIGHAIVLPTCK